MKLKCLKSIPSNKFCNELVKNHIYICKEIEEKYYLKNDFIKENREILYAVYGDDNKLIDIFSKNLFESIKTRRNRILKQLINKNKNIMKTNGCPAQ